MWTGRLRPQRKSRHSKGPFYGSAIIDNNGIHPKLPGATHQIQPDRRAAPRLRLHLSHCPSHSGMHGHDSLSNALRNSFLTTNGERLTNPGELMAPAIEDVLGF